MKCGHARFAHALDLLQSLWICSQNSGERPELGDQVLGQWLGVALPYRCEQEEF